MNTYRTLVGLFGLVGLACVASMMSACSSEFAAEEEIASTHAELALSSSSIDELVASAKHWTVRVPRRFNVPYSGMAAAEFPNGVPLSIGSGLRVKRGAGPWLTFVGLADRGPNGDAPDYVDAAGVIHSTKAFLNPDFSPEVVTIEVLPFWGPTVTSVTPLRINHVPVNGIPLAEVSPEVGLTEQLTAMPSSPVGVDPEGIDFDAHGNLWLCEEFGPSLLKVRPHSGEIVRILRPGSGLPTVLSGRQPTRGFEGVAVTPNGKVYAMVQSTLDINASTKGKAQFIRMVEYDPETGSTRMFAYPHDIGEYAKSGDAKLSDLYALDNEHFLVLELGKDKNKNLRNLVYAVDISGASDLSGMTLTSGSNAGLDLEYGTAEEVAAQVTMMKKALVVNLRDYGWAAEKSEGLAMLDRHTLVVSNDQDFGVAASMTGDPASTDPSKYVIDSTGALTFSGAASSGTYELHAMPEADQERYLFVVRLNQPIQAYLP